MEDRRAEVVLRRHVVAHLLRDPFASSGSLVRVDPVHDEVLAVTGLSTAAPVDVRVFQRTATGTPAPVRTLTVLPAQATAWAGLLLDAAHDEVWVTVTAGSGTSGTFVNRSVDNNSRGASP